MDRFRNIQPKTKPQDHLVQDVFDQHQFPPPEGAGSLDPSEPKRQTRQHHTEAEWEAIRPDLTTLLLSHDLKEAAEIIRRTHNFEAGLRSYRSKVAEWGLKQHQSSELLGIVVAKREKRKRDEGKNTVVIVRNEQFTTERLELFQRRAKDKQSPSAATPQSIEYYTPANNGLTPEVARTPAGLQNSLRYLGLLNTLPENKEHKDFCKRLMTFDRISEPIILLQHEPDYETVRTPTIGKAEKKMEKATTDRSAQFMMNRAEGSLDTQHIALRTDSQVPVKPTHDLHQSGRVAIAGRGRFAKKEKALELLWKTKNLGRDMQEALDLTKSPAKFALSGQQADAGDGVSYFMRTRASSAQTEQKQQRLINFMRNDNYIQSILGLTKQDRRRWLQSWTRTAEDEAPMILATANHLFGDLLRSYPEMDVIEVVVFFQTALPHREPILIRVSAGWDPRDETLNCYYCDDAFQIIDFLGSSGAVKLHISRSSSPLTGFSSFESFRDAFSTSQKRIYTSWSEVAYVFQGWDYVPLLRRCPCDSKTHKNEVSEHYINVFDEQMIEDEGFDPQAKSYLQVPFDPFPSEEENKLLIYGVTGRKGPPVERWDPLGEDGSEEEFDPYPEADHGSVSDSKALKFHLLM